ncbi:MFS transporter [Opitutaceae bacterium EW11]|nr:MFS transporter [Opitutaceae bacterium EW11]
MSAATPTAVPANADRLAPLPLLAIFNLSFGFLGIQFGWGLQMANMSAIYQYLGASEGQLPILWLAAPLTGLIVQPIIGYYSDRTWTRLGRRRPYFLCGALLASAALVAMPNSSTLWMAAGLLWVLDASVNISMEPFRAFVGDLLPPKQRKSGFAMQSMFIGFGAVVSQLMPLFMSRVLGVSGTTAGSHIPRSVELSFYIGAVVFLGAVLYTIVTTKEHPPAGGQSAASEASHGALGTVGAIFGGVLEMPRTMRRLAVVQFFTWLGLFCLWIYFTPAIAQTIFHGKPGSPEYENGVEWGGFCFSIYSFVAFGFAFVLLAVANRFSARAIHAVCLCCGALGLISVGWWENQYGLIVSMVGVGIAWASILSMPYALLANCIPPTRMGYFMGVFNFFIVLPQIVASTLLGPVVNHFVQGRPMPVVMAGGVSLLFAAAALAFVREDTPATNAA